MGFRLAKAAGVRVPDEILISMDKDLVVPGQAVELDGTVAVTNAAVAGICVSDYGMSSDVGASASFSPTFPKGADGSDEVEALVLPVTGTLLIEADIVANAATVVGSEVNITAGGLTLTYNATGVDFRVLKILASNGTGPTIVAGVFLTPGYFAS